MAARDRSPNHATWWQPKAHVDLSMMRATFTTFTYDRHAHEEYAIGVIEQGVQGFTHKGTSHALPPLGIVTVNPDEVHDGSALTREGYTYRMLYVGAEFLRGLFAPDAPDPTPERSGLMVFPSPVTHAPDIARRLLATHRMLEREAAQPDTDQEAEPSRAEELLAPVLHDLFLRHAMPRPLCPPGTGCDKAMQRAVDHLRACAHQNPALDDLARDAGMSKFHFLRTFKKHTGLTPHAYALRQRVRMAQKALEQGFPAAEAALIAGFADQSHFTRRFKAVFGVTPGAWVRGLKTTTPSSRAISF